jgi:hypothetical protein
LRFKEARKEGGKFVTGIFEHERPVARAGGKALIRLSFTLALLRTSVALDLAGIMGIRNFHLQWQKLHHYPDMWSELQENAVLYGNGYNS